MVLVSDSLGVNKRRYDYHQQEDYRRPRLLLQKRSSAVYCAAVVLVFVMMQFVYQNIADVQTLYRQLGDELLFNHPVNFGSLLTLDYGNDNRTITATKSLEASSNNLMIRQGNNSLRQILEDQRQPVRVLLGIESPLYFSQHTAHHMIRTSYLDFDRRNSDQPNPVCSLQKYIQGATTSTSSYQQHCRLIYAFVAAKGASSSRHASRPIVSRDTIYLAVKDTDLVGRRWAWFQYASSILNNTTNIPLVAYMQTTGIIHSTNFWYENPLLFEKSLTGPLEAIYAGTYQVETSCRETFCSSLERRKSFMRGFVMLSSDLVHYIASQPVPVLNRSSDSPDVAIANAFNDRNLSHPKIQEIEIKGVDMPLYAQMGGFLSRWDVYRDSVVQYIDPVQTAYDSMKHPTLRSKKDHRWPRFLLGIFTTDSPMDLKRRTTIRETYLSAFVNSSTPHRICSFYELDTFMEDDEFVCEIAYVFVTGGNPDGPTEQLEETESSGPIALREVPESVRLPDHDKHDIVYLNIKENMEDGKTPTYFKYATLMVDEHYFDYIAKVDGDTVLNVHILLNSLRKELPVFPGNIRVYGGFMTLPKISRLGKLIGPAYAAGPFYFLSPDMARYITSTDCPRRQVDAGIEDITMSNFVYSHPRHIHRFNTGRGVRYHPYKDITAFRVRWEKAADEAHKDVAQSSS